MWDLGLATTPLAGLRNILENNVNSPQMLWIVSIFVLADGGVSTCLKNSMESVTMNMSVSSHGGNVATEGPCGHPLLGASA